MGWEVEEATCFRVSTIMEGVNPVTEQVGGAAPAGVVRSRRKPQFPFLQPIPTSLLVL